MVPRAVLMKSGLVSINTARQNISKGAVLVNTTRQVNDAHLKITVNAARLMSYLSKTTHSTVKRPIHKNIAFKNSNINQRVNIVKDKKINTSRPKAAVNAVKGNNLNAVKGNPHMDLQYQGVIDSGCSRHMTGNMSYLTDYEEIDGGYVSFGGNPKGGKITGKGTIKTGNLDFENVYFVRGLKFNLFSVSQMCDKKNSVPKGGLTCLFAKVTSDESKLWHRWLGRLNFKTINKLVKGNLVTLTLSVRDTLLTVIAHLDGYSAQLKRVVFRSIQYPREIAENVLIKVDKFFLPVDFVILDMREDTQIYDNLSEDRLGREVIFDVVISINNPTDDDECYGIDNLNQTIHLEAQELMENDHTDSFLLNDLDIYEANSEGRGERFDFHKSIRRIKFHIRRI
ncbi:hypothetical protein Tco_0221101 [Tanacetum coccineum]